MEAQAFGFRHWANAPESQKAIFYHFPISRSVSTGKHARHVLEMDQAQILETLIDG